MNEIPELQHTHNHGTGAPIAVGTPISLAELCGVENTDRWGGFVQHYKSSGPADFEDAAGKKWHEDNHVSDSLRFVGTLTGAHGIWFDCPLCWAKNGGSVGTHGVLVWFAGSPVPPELGKNAAGETVRWTVAGGTGLSDLQLTPSVLLLGGCGWHGFVGSGGVQPGFAR